jgi:hypothetical protein
MTRRLNLQRFSLGCVLFPVGAKLVFALRDVGLRLGDHKDRPYTGCTQLRTAIRTLPLTEKQPKSLATKRLH